MKKILIVEDNELNMKLFFDILEYQKYTPIKAINGLEAYKVIKEEELDLIILDVQLPKLNGFELLEKLKKENINLPPIIIVSACAMDSDKQKAKEFKIEDYITKPIDINNFIKTVKQRLGEI
ncbi:MAG: response regulator [Candidatus Gastranaerophilales bacterium]|nr:response regulator [Candidatus Gastranaerophilales bacterium]